MSLETASTTDKGNTPDNPMLYLGVVATIVVVAAIGAFVVLKHKKKQ